MTTEEFRVGTALVHLPRRIDKPWGFELIVAHTDRYVGKLLHIDPGHALSRQYHEVKDETIFVTKGELVLEIGPAESAERKVVPAGMGFRVFPKMIHRFVAEKEVELFEVSTPELEDVVRLEDRYGREGTQAP